MNTNIDMIQKKMKNYCEKYYDHVLETKEENDNTWMNLSHNYDAELYGMARMILIIFGSDEFDKALIPIRKYRDKIDKLYVS